MENKIINIIAEVCENETIKDNLDIDLIKNEIYWIFFSFYKFNIKT